MRDQIKRLLELYPSARSSTPFGGINGGIEHVETAYFIMNSGFQRVIRRSSAPPYLSKAHKRLKAALVLRQIYLFLRQFLTTVSYDNCRHLTLWAGCIYRAGG